jgi:hypothetical protein
MYRYFFAMDLSPSENSIIGCFSLMNSISDFDADGVCIELDILHYEPLESDSTSFPCCCRKTVVSGLSSFQRWLSFLSNIATTREAVGNTTGAHHHHFLHSSQQAHLPRPQEKGYTHPSYSRRWFFPPRRTHSRTAITRRYCDKYIGFWRVSVVL